MRVVFVCGDCAVLFEMKFLPTVLSILSLLTASLHAAAPVVSNLSASQRTGTKLVDITYDVSADTPTVTISLEVSSDGGATFNVPATSLSGAIGEGVAVGTGKTITWDAGADWNEQSSSTMRFKVVADDGMALPALPGFIGVAAGSLPESSWAGAQALDAFYMAKTEVTWAQFQDVRTWAAANGYDIASVGAGTGPNRPVTNVNWYQALKWCNAWSEKDSLDPVYKIDGAVYRSGDSVPTVDATANGYRLPSEKEWEFAARGGVHTNGYEYSGSNDINAVAWYAGNSGNLTQDVATKQANELGIHDMSGNVWEWCFDLIPRTYRVHRGGGLESPADNCRVANRGIIGPTFSDSDAGFRVTRGLTYLTYTTDDVVVDTNIAAPVLGLESFYESNSGESITIDATPTAGYPTEFSYQWYFNSVAIPSFSGGTRADYVIDATPDFEGSWKVEVTNTVGTSTAEFEYRVFTDTDADGLSDYRESNITNTNPSLPDTDSDGLNDYEEVVTHSTDPNNTDTDNDGVNDYLEVNTYGSDPKNADSDTDGLSDGEEVNTHSTDPNDADSDDDSLLDGAEINTHGTNPNLSDTDADGLSDADEINTHQTNPNVADSDNDGLSDGNEINTHSTNPLVADSSGDGLADGFVVNAGFDPNTDYSALLTASALNARGYYTGSQMVDARAGSVGIVRDGNSATLQLQIQRSEDLETWSSHQDDLISVPMSMPGNKQFFRFAIPQE